MEIVCPMKVIIRKYIRTYGKFLPDYIAKNQPTLTIISIQSPHDPTMFREDGSALLENQWHNWKDKQLYIGQVKIYKPKPSKNVIQNIKESDPDALVIIQS